MYPNGQDLTPIHACKSSKKDCRPMQFLNRFQVLLSEVTEVYILGYVGETPVNVAATLHVRVSFHCRISQTREFYLTENKETTLNVRSSSLCKLLTAED